MTGLFVRVLNMAVRAGWPILFLLLLQPVRRRLPGRWNCTLWELAALRLLVPGFGQSRFSLIPAADPVPADIAEAWVPQVRSGIGFLDRMVNRQLVSGEGLFAAGVGASLDRFARIWAAGTMFLLLFFILRAGMTVRRVREAVPEGEGILRCGWIGTAFAAGVFRPRIYLPCGLSPEEKAIVLAHERAHIRRRDPLRLLASRFLLCVYWFCPAVWLWAFIYAWELERACDETALEELGAGSRKRYAETLLRFSASAPGGLPAFGGRSVAGRVRRVMEYRGFSRQAVLVSAVLCLLLTACFLTDPRIPAQPVVPAGVSGGDNGAVPVYTVRLGEDVRGTFTVESYPNGDFTYYYCTDGFGRHLHR